MNMTHHNNFNSIRDSIENLVELKFVFEHCLNFFLRLPNCSIGVKGSLASGEVDFLSDIDFVIFSESMHLPQISSLLVKQISSIGKILSWFDAVHINKPNLFIFYLKVNDKIIKLDIEILVNTEIVSASLGKNFLILNDERRAFEDQLKSKEDIPSFDLLYQKFSVWLWNIFCRIERGEYFQAARSIDFSREHALLPVIRKNLGLTIMDGHRRIEILFPPSIIDDLELTYPKQLAYIELIKSLFKLIEIFELNWINLKKNNELELLFEIKQIIKKHVEIRYPHGFPE